MISFFVLANRLGTAVVTDMRTRPHSDWLTGAIAGAGSAWRSVEAW